MISFQKRFLFVHIPKTGGNSIQTVLRDYSEDEVVARHDRQDGVERFAVRNPKYNLKKHSKLAEYSDALGREQFSNLYKFTVVRNPWDRMVSFYFTPGRGKSWDAQEFEKIIRETKGVADFLRLEKDDVDPFSNVDRIVRFERLEEDFRAVCEHLAIPLAPLPKYNRSEREHYSKYYDERSRKIVNERFADEIEAFGYSFESAIKVSQ